MSAGRALRRAAEAPRGLRDYAAAALAQGCPVSYTGSGHLKWRSPSGQLVITPSTPGQGRSIPNSRAQLRQAGFRLAAEQATTPNNRRQAMTAPATEATASAIEATPAVQTYTEEILAAARAAHAVILKAAAEQGNRRCDIPARSGGPAEGIPGYLWTGVLGGVVSALRPGDPDFESRGRQSQAVTATLSGRLGNVVMAERHQGESLWWVRAEFSETRLLPSEYRELLAAITRPAPTRPAPAARQRVVEVIWCTWRLITGCTEEFDTDWKRRVHLRESHGGQAVELTHCNAPVDDGSRECRRGPMSGAGRAIHLSQVHGIHSGTLRRAELDAALAKEIWDRERPEGAQGPDRTEALPPGPAAVAVATPAVAAPWPANTPSTAAPNGQVPSPALNGHGPVPSVDQALDAFAAIVDAAQSVPGLRAELAEARARIAELEDGRAAALAALRGAFGE